MFTLGETSKSTQQQNRMDTIMNTAIGINAQKPQPPKDFLAYSLALHALWFYIKELEKDGSFIASELKAGKKRVFSITAMASVWTMVFAMKHVAYNLRQVMVRFVEDDIWFGPPPNDEEQRLLEKIAGELDGKIQQMTGFNAYHVINQIPFMLVEMLSNQTTQTKNSPIPDFGTEHFRRMLELTHAFMKFFPHCSEEPKKKDRAVGTPSTKTASR